MGFRFPCLVALLALALGYAAPAIADDQQKAEKQIRRIAAMASDVTARGIVSNATAAMLEVKRDQLVRERRAMNLNYGQVFLAHQLTAKGGKMLDIALQLGVGKNIYQIANDRHADWRQIAAEAKKLNNKIEDNIYKHFLHVKTDNERDAAEKYSATQDWVKADADATPAELLEAQEVYVLWRSRAAQVGGQGVNVSSSEELASHKIEERTHEMRVPPPGSH
jgi:hypothetical protein